MNSVLISSHGHIKFGQIPKLDASQLKPHQVLIKVEAAALNPSDILFMRGKYNIKLDYPYTPGWEGSGTIVDASEKLKKQGIVGQRVAFMKEGELGSYKIGGAMAEYCITSIRSVIPIPDETISFDHASSFFVNPLTAVCMVERVGHLNAKACIVTASASQIGRMIIPLLIQSKITPICLVRRQQQTDILVSLFGDKIKGLIIDTSKSNYKKEMQNICNKYKPSTCLECVSGQTTGEMLEYMGYQSTLILYGLLSDQPAGGINTISFIGKAQTIESFLLNSYLIMKSKEDYQKLIQKAQSMYKNELKTEIQARYGFHQITEAIEFYQKNQTAGKVVLIPSLTQSNQPETQPVQLDNYVAKL